MAHNAELHEASRRRDVEKVAALMKKEGLDGRSYAIAISSRADVGDAEGAMEWLRIAKEKGLKPEVAAYTAALKALCSVGDQRRAKGLLEAMAQESKRAQPNLRTVNTYLRGCLRHGWVDDARWCDGRSKVWGIIGDASTRNYLATIFAAALKPGGVVPPNNESSSSEALAVLARAHAVLGDASECRRLANLGLTITEQDEHQGRENEARRKSNEVYRRHRADETRRRLTFLKGLPDRDPATGALERALLVTDDGLVVARKLGLTEVYWRTEQLRAPHESRSARKVRAAAVRDRVASLEKRLHEAFTTDDAVVDLGSFFFQDDKKPLCIELGAGDGEFAARRAKSSEEERWIANEVRVDRTAAIVGRIALENIHNLATICGPALAMLAKTKPRSVAKCFVRFPEPPIQVTGDADYDGRHMLDAVLFRRLADVLQFHGELEILTDNPSYARLLLDIVRRVNMGLSDGRFHSIDGSSSSQKKKKMRTPLTEKDGLRVDIVDPGTDDTYFDRLWRTGVSQHSDNKRRFLLHLGLKALPPPRGKRTLDDPPLLRKKKKKKHSP